MPEPTTAPEAPTTLPPAAATPVTPETLDEEPGEEAPTTSTAGVSGAQIRAAREALGWSRFALGKAADVAQGTVARIEERGDATDFDPRMRRSAEKLWAALQAAKPAAPARARASGWDRSAPALPRARRGVALVREADAPFSLTIAHVEALASFLPDAALLEAARTTPGLSLTPACELALGALEHLRATVAPAERAHG